MLLEKDLQWRLKNDNGSNRMLNKIWIDNVNTQMKVACDTSGKENKVYNSVIMTLNGWVRRSYQQLLVKILLIELWHTNVD